MNGVKVKQWCYAFREGHSNVYYEKRSGGRLSILSDDLDKHDV